VNCEPSHLALFVTSDTSPENGVRKIWWRRRESNYAWAVFGAARLWFQTPNRVPAEEMAARIETMVSPVLFGASQ